eukprot:2251305-Prymnesium_polylepis.2
MTPRGGGGGAWAAYVGARATSVAGGISATVLAERERERHVRASAAGTATCHRKGTQITVGGVRCLAGCARRGVLRPGTARTPRDALGVGTAGHDSLYEAEGQGRPPWQSETRPTRPDRVGSSAVCGVVRASVARATRACGTGNEGVAAHMRARGVRGSTAMSGGEASAASIMACHCAGTNRSA